LLDLLLAVSDEVVFLRETLRGGELVRLGHTVDVNLNVYAQSSIEVRLPLVNQLERSLVN
jgi:hypothetical protein